MLIPLALAGCDDQTVTTERSVPEYLGATSEFLDDDLLQVRVEMTDALKPADVAAYADCAAAAAALERGYGFARHVRISLDEADGVWTGDLVYMLSAELPDGITRLDTEVLAADCREKEIPLE